MGKFVLEGAQIEFVVFCWQKQLLIEFPAHEDDTSREFLRSCRAELMEYGFSSARVRASSPTGATRATNGCKHGTERRTIYLPNGDSYVSSIYQWATFSLTQTTMMYHELRYQRKCLNPEQLKLSSKHDCDKMSFVTIRRVMSPTEPRLQFNKYVLGRSDHSWQPQHNRFYYGNENTYSSISLTHTQSILCFPLKRHLKM